MKSFFTSILLLLLFTFSGYASHISGGELYYEYLGPGSVDGTSKYKITMRLFRDCASSGQVLTAETVNIGIYNAGSLTQNATLSLPLQLPISTIRLNTNAIPCLTNPPSVCFQVGIFSSTIELVDNNEGYVLSWLRCCRADGLANLSINTGVGATFTTGVPGKLLVPFGHNNSPQFAIKDTALVCKNKNFILDFGATDADGDTLTYSFCDAFSGGTATDPNPGPAANLSLNPLPYLTPTFSGNNPLGSAVTINPTTGIITGVAPAAGRYVINVCVTERRNGVVINTHRKDFILAIGNCDFAAATPVALSGEPYISTLPYKYLSCNDFDVSFSNQNSSSTIQSALWDFGVQGVTTDTSTKINPTFTFPDTGIYVVRLIVRATSGCTDTNATVIGVYPGFNADFSYTGSCYQSPFQFQDKSFVRFGIANTWQWDFGQGSTNADTANVANPSYLYPVAGNKNVRLIVTSSKGCKDTSTNLVIVRAAPVLTLPFKDTLICSIDSLTLKAIGTGSFSWIPLYNILNTGSAFPIVFPKKDTFYTVTLNDAGCISRDSIRVNVVDSVSVDAGNDTTICKTDDFILHPTTNATGFIWTPLTIILSGANTRQPIIKPDTTTRVRLIATIGKCFARDSLLVKVVPYPIADAGTPITICYPDKGQLQGKVVGSSFEWTPQIWLNNASILNPITSASQSVSYILTARDTLGCPKPTSDTVLVTVIPKVYAFAGNDTAIVANQPLQLNATGGINYSWSPSNGLDSPQTAHPIATLGANFDSITYRVRVSSPEGCFAIDEIKIVIFKTAPDLFIPSAFTPNGDNRNDVLRPIAAGIKTLNYFRVFNRWGQLVFSTSRLGDGWNGKVNGKDQATNTYIYMADATDYLGRKIVKKGTVVLIR